MKGEEMVGACGTYVGKRNIYRALWGKRLYGKPG